MEYVPGEDLKKHHPDDRAAELGHGPIAIAKQVCEGLAEAHRWASSTGTSSPRTS